jgi:hypothetical protein
MKKYTMKEFIGLAELLFQLENESIGNDPDGHWMARDWYDKFGEKSIQFEPKLASTEKDHKELAKLIKEDYEKGFWVADKDGLYHPDMLDQYGGFIDEVFEMQLADFTGIGTQMEMFK